MSKTWWILVPILFASGCSPILKISLFSPEDFEHDDMSHSLVAPDLEKRADELVENPERPRDLKVAAEIYGRINKLDKMKMAALKYLEYEPEDGARLLWRWQKTNEWYETHSTD